ncbi:MAG TPA: metal-dependent hydrolase [Pyrinomonadaceae bacterium]|nr:metal-dependent hydrolase [Pyrinomonadaceae bacterium]
MDNLTHSLVGLSLSKAGLERVSPYATTVCLLSANAADADFVALFFGDRWTLLHHHRGITHSIIGTIAIGVIVPLVVMTVERALARIRKRRPTIRIRGLMIASLIAAGTHPLMDWTNNYGVRPLLPWSGRWFYGDLVYIVDPYIWLLLGAAMFLLTSKGRLRIFAWAALAAITTTLIVLASIRGADASALRFLRVIWIAGVIAVVVIRATGLYQRLNHRAALAALTLVLMYWGGLAVAHRVAYTAALAKANQLANRRGEAIVKVASMPMTATPFRWQSVAETDRAFYRYPTAITGDDRATALSDVRRFEKPTGRAAELVSIAERDRRAQEFLLFARFPIAVPESSDCIGQALVQFADIRYTEPGATRGAFSVNVPVDCPAR